MRVTWLYPSTVASFLMPNHLAGSTGSLYRADCLISAGNRLVSFARGCEEEKRGHVVSRNTSKSFFFFFFLDPMEHLSSYFNRMSV